MTELKDVWDNQLNKPDGGTMTEESSTTQFILMECKGCTKEIIEVEIQAPLPSNFEVRTFGDAGYCKGCLGAIKLKDGLRYMGSYDHDKIRSLIDEYLQLTHYTTVKELEEELSNLWDYVDGSMNYAVRQVLLSRLRESRDKREEAARS